MLVGRLVVWSVSWSVINEFLFLASSEQLVIGWYVEWLVGRLVGWSVGQLVGQSVGWLVSWSIGVIVLKSGKTHISAPAHLSTTGGCVSGLV